MRWFKHMTAARRDERIASYMDEAKNPIEAYGFWWLLLEVVAEQMGKDDTKCSATYSLLNWSRLLYCHHHKVGNLLGNLEGNGLVTLQWEKTTGGRKVTVTIPNLLKYRDEYSRKSGQQSGGTPDKLRSKKQKQNTEAETEKEKKEEPALRAAELTESELWKIAKERGVQGSVLGKLARDYDKETLNEKLRIMIDENPVDPVSYLHRLLRPTVLPKIAGLI